jgi:hypothetical protein
MYDSKNFRMLWLMGDIVSKESICGMINSACSVDHKGAEYKEEMDIKTGVKQ